MICCPQLRRFLAVFATVGVLTSVIVIASCTGPAGVAGAQRGNEKGRGKENRVEPRLADVRRHASAAWNTINPNEKDMPTSWDVDKGTNIKWSEKLGSKAYGGPTIAGGKIYVTAPATLMLPARPGRQGR